MSLRELRRQFPLGRPDFSRRYPMAPHGPQLLEVLVEMLLQSTIGKTALMIENEMFRGLHTELTGRGQLHMSRRRDAGYEPRRRSPTWGEQTAAPRSDPWAHGTPRWREKDSNPRSP
jgi:hypothetical protein